MSNAGAGLYGSGLERDDWYALKNVLIEYSLEDTKAAFERLPSRLQASTVGARIREYVQSGEPARREDAVALMAPGMSNVELLLVGEGVNYQRGRWPDHVSHPIHHSRRSLATTWNCSGAVPEFGASGGARQYLFDKPVRELIDDGSLEVIPRRPSTKLFKPRSPMPLKCREGVTCTASAPSAVAALAHNQKTRAAVHVGTRL